jgi:hypothetical protein
VRVAAFRHLGVLDPMVAGALGGTLAKWTTFVPCFLWIFLGGPYIEALRGNKALTASLSAITVAAVGIFRFKVGMIPTLVACCAAGMLLFYTGMLS